MNLFMGKFPLSDLSGQSFIYIMVTVNGTGKKRYNAKISLHGWVMMSNITRYANYDGTPPQYITGIQVFLHNSFPGMDRSKHVSCMAILFTGSDTSRCSPVEISEKKAVRPPLCWLNVSLVWQRSRI